MTREERNALLIRLDERTEYLTKWTERHIELHTRLTLAFVGAAISSLLALGTTVVSLIMMLNKHGIS